MKRKNNKNTLKALCIGNIKLKNNLVMAPMAGITDLPFRSLAVQGGAGLVCTEMVSAKALLYNDHKTKSILKIDKKEHPVSAQLFGSDHNTVSNAAEIVENSGADILDINLGCPAKKIIKSGAGSKLLEKPGEIARIIEATVKKVKIPVTIKIRLGLSDDNNIAPEIVNIAQKSGAKAVTIHGRSVSRGHKGSPDLKGIRKAVTKAKIPIIGNGGIIDEHTASIFLKETDCNGLMIGRAAIGDPGIFRRINHFLKTGEKLPEFTWEDRIEVFKKHVTLAAKYYGENIGIVKLRKLAAYYFKGLPNASRIRDMFCKMSSLKEVDEIFKVIWKSKYFNN